MRFPAIVGLGLAGILLAASGGAAQPMPAARADSPKIVATVDDAPIYDSEVEAELLRAAQQLAPGKQGKLEEQEQRRLRSRILDVLVRRQLILTYLHGQGLGASEVDIDQAVSRVKQGLAQQDIEFDQYLRKQGLDSARFRRNMDWRLSWRRFTERYLTEENLERYFQKNRRRFDGTQLRVAHILRKLESPTQEAIAAASKELEDLRSRILKGEVSFAEAARQHSAAPSKAKGGEIGWISRYAPMSESFSQAAFGLEVGQLSQPVLTAAGAHLIQCLEIKPGDQTWRQVTPQLRRDMSQYLFRWAAEQQRPKSTVRYLGETPDMPPASPSPSEPSAPPTQP